MKIEELVDNYQDLFYDFYIFQKNSLRNGILLEIKFNKFDLFRGILHINKDDQTDLGFLGLIQTNPMFNFQTIESISKNRTMIPSIYFFEDDEIELSFFSGDKKTNKTDLILKDLSHFFLSFNDLFLIETIKNKSFKIFIKLKNESSSRIYFENELFLKENQNIEETGKIYSNNILSRLEYISKNEKIPFDLKNNFILFIKSFFKDNSFELKDKDVFVLTFLIKEIRNFIFEQRNIRLNRKTTIDLNARIIHLNKNFYKEINIFKNDILNFQEKLKTNKLIIREYYD